MKNLEVIKAQLPAIERKWEDLQELTREYSRESSQLDDRGEYAQEIIATNDTMYQLMIDTTTFFKNTFIVCEYSPRVLREAIDKAEQSNDIHAMNHLSSQLDDLIGKLMGTLVGQRRSILGVMDNTLEIKEYGFIPHNSINNVLDNMEELLVMNTDIRSNLLAIKTQNEEDLNK